MRRYLTVSAALCVLLFSLSARAQGSANLVNLTLTVPQYNQIYVADLDIQHVQSTGVLFSAGLQSLSSSPQQVKLKLTINVTLANGNAYQDIADATTKPFTLEAGQMKVITNLDLSGENPPLSVESSHYNSDQVGELKNVALATGKAPAGIYEFILQCTDVNGNPVSQTVRGTIVVTNPSQVELALPLDQESITTLFPHFQWTSNADTVQLSVYEKLPSQMSAEDVVSGVPFLQVTVPNSSSPFPGSFNYPPSGAGVRPLQQGKTYYWYVMIPSSATRGSGIRSDIWSFTIGGMDTSMTAGNVNEQATSELKNFLAGTGFESLLSQIGTLTGQGTYDGSQISVQEIIDILKGLNKSKISNVTIQ